MVDDPPAFTVVGLAERVIVGPLAVVAVELVVVVGFVAVVEEVVEETVVVIGAAAPVPPDVGEVTEVVGDVTAVVAGVIVEDAVGVVAAGAITFDP